MPVRTRAQARAEAARALATVRRFFPYDVIHGICTQYLETFQDPFARQEARLLTLALVAKSFKEVCDDLDARTVCLRYASAGKLFIGAVERDQGRFIGVTTVHVELLKWHTVCSSPSQSEDLPEAVQLHKECDLAEIRADIEGQARQLAKAVTQLPLLRSLVIHQRSTMAALPICDLRLYLNIAPTALAHLHPLDPFVGLPSAGEAHADRVQLHELAKVPRMARLRELAFRDGQPIDARCHAVYIEQDGAAQLGIFSAHWKPHAGHLRLRLAGETDQEYWARLSAADDEGLARCWTDRAVAALLAACPRLEVLDADVVGWGSSIHESAKRLSMRHRHLRRIRANTPHLMQTLFSRGYSSRITLDYTELINLHSPIDTFPLPAVDKLRCEELSLAGYRNLNIALSPLPHLRDIKTRSCYIASQEESHTALKQLIGLARLDLGMLRDGRPTDSRNDSDRHCFDVLHSIIKDTTLLPALRQLSCSAAFTRAEVDQLVAAATARNVDFSWTSLTTPA